MKVQQELTDLNKMIIESSIYVSIMRLQESLEIYQKSKTAKVHQYCIQIEFNEVQEELNKLKNTLDALIDHSIQWEAIS